MKTKQVKSNGSEPKGTFVDLYPDDTKCIEKIKETHGLLRVSDCIRFALRETVRQIETSKQAAA